MAYLTIKLSLENWKLLQRENYLEFCQKSHILGTESHNNYFKEGLPNVQNFQTDFCLKVHPKELGKNNLLDKS